MCTRRAVKTSITLMYSITSTLSVALQAVTNGCAIGTTLSGVQHRALSITARGRGSKGVNVFRHLIIKSIQLNILYVHSIMHAYAKVLCFCAQMPASIYALCDIIYIYAILSAKH